MESIPVNLYYWKPTNEDKKLGLKILTAIEQMTIKAGVDIPLQPQECSVNSEEPRNPADFNIIFGQIAFVQVPTDPAYMYTNLGNIKDLYSQSGKTNIRQNAYVLMQNMADKIATYHEDSKSIQQAHIETENGTTVGKIGTDIVVTEAEAEYLCQLKELLKGSKVVVTKGDIKIEVT